MLFILISSLFTILSPLLIAYRSHDFWLKSESYQEQPDVHFKHDYLLIIQTDKLEAPIICSTNVIFSELTNNRDQCIMIKSREEDYNRDSKYDELHIEIHVQLSQNQLVHGLHLFLVFDYKLYKGVRLQMESLGVIQYSSSLPGARLDVAGDLSLNQKQILTSHGRDFRFNKSVFEASDFPESLSLAVMLKEYARRNISTILKNMYPVWITGRPSDKPFVVSATIFYPEHTILYKPGFWHIIKWAWMQYISILIIFIYIFRTIKSFIFRNQLVFSIKEVPWKKMQ